LALLLFLVLAFPSAGLSQDDSWNRFLGRFEKCKKPSVEQCRKFDDLMAMVEKDRSRLKKLADSGNPRLETAALRIMGRTAPDAEVLSTLLGSKEPEVRIEAMNLAANTGQTGLGAAILELARKAKENQEQREMLRAVNALGRLGYQEAFPFVLELVGDEHKKVSRVAIQALSAFTGAEVTQVLSRYATDGTLTARTRIAAIFGLGNLKDPKATELLVTLVRGEEEAVRGPAVKALAQTGDRGVVSELVDLLGDAAVEEPLIFTLGTLGGAKAGSMLMAIYRDEKRGDKTRFDALCGAGRAGADAALEPLLKKVGAGSESTRIEAIQALGYLGSPEAVERIFERFKKGKAREKNMAHWAIRNCSGKALETKEDIEEYLEERNK